MLISDGFFEFQYSINAHHQALVVVFQYLSTFFLNSRLPEIDPEVADKLLSVCDDLPKFSQLSVDKIFTIVGKSIMDYECVVRNTDRKLHG